MGTRASFAALRERWWLPLIGLMIGGLVALAVNLSTTPLYTAQTQLFVSTTGGTSSADVFQGSQFSQQRVASYVELLEGGRLAERVVGRLNLDVSPAALADEVAASPVANTVLINVLVSDPLPTRAQQIAEAVGAEFTDLVQELETPDGMTTSPVKVTVTKGPDLPMVPSEPKSTRNVVLGLLAGLVVGTGATLSLKVLDTSIKSAKTATELVDVPVVGTVFKDDSLATQHILDLSRATRVAEDYRQLRANLQFVDVDDPPKVIMVSSAMPSEGKTTLIVNLALTLAESGRQVTIVDADLRRPRLTLYLGMVAGVGLTNVLSGTADVGEVAQSYGEDGISVIGSGPSVPNPSQLLASGHMSSLIEELRAKSDFVLIDSPPVLPVADATGLAVAVDGVLMSVRYGKTRKDQLEQAVSTLNGVGAKVLGLVLNIVPARADIAAAYGYGETYAEPTSAKRRRHAADSLPS
jgi:receptor protein-tyrosine kinase